MCDILIELPDKTILLTNCKQIHFDEDSIEFEDELILNMNEVNK